MSPREIAHWLSEEHAIVQEQVYALRKLLAVPPVAGRAGWLPELRERFNELKQHLKKHMALEESGGYMKGVLKRRPTLAPQIDSLHHEHNEMERLADQIDAALAELQPADSLLIRHSIARIGMFLAYVEHHKEQEEHLVLYTFTEDLGTGD